MNKLERIIGYNFTNKNLLKQALTHPSLKLTNNNAKHYERYEFLGDSVLNLVITKFLVDRYKNETEGNLAKRRAVLVSGPTLSAIAEKIDLGSFLIMADGEESSGGRTNLNNLENSLEALIAAMYLDGGLEIVEKFILTYWTSIIESMIDVPSNPKNKLQEWSQERKKGIPQYNLINVSGLAHDPTFEIEVVVDEDHKASAIGGSKKEAQTNAAKKLLAIIKERKNNGK